VKIYSAPIPMPLADHTFGGWKNWLLAIWTSTVQTHSHSIYAQNGHIALTLRP